MNKLIIFIILLFALTGCEATVGNGEDTANDIVVKRFEVGGENVFVGGTEMELGATTADLDNFKPEVKLEKWGDETYIRIWSDEEGDKKAKLEDGKIKWKTKDKKKEYNFYPLTPEEAGTEDGGFEYEVILLEKPDSNVINLNIEAQDLQFLYQPEIDDTEVQQQWEVYQEMLNDPQYSDIKHQLPQSLEETRETIRPSDVVGSYAVYHKTKRNHLENQTNYKTGKAFHIYRPQMEDAIGTKVWGELRIENGVLSVTIPQDFLDNAVYPIKHASGLKFGYETQGGSNTASSDVLSCLWDTSEGTAGDGDYIMSYTWTFSNDTKGGIYKKSDETILANGVTEIDSNGGAGWLQFDFPSAPTIEASTDYWICTVSDGILRWYYDQTAPAKTFNRETSYDYTNMPDANLSSPTNHDSYLSMWINYTEAAGPADTCTAPASGDWYVSASDNCYVTTDTYVNGYTYIINNTGPGTLNVIDGASLFTKGVYATGTFLWVESASGAGVYRFVDA